MDMKVTKHIHAVPNLRMHGAIHPFPPTYLNDVFGDRSLPHLTVTTPCCTARGLSVLVATRPAVPLCCPEVHYISNSDWRGQTMGGGGGGGGHVIVPRLRTTVSTKIVLLCVSRRHV